jgi:hypothetical protein
MDRRCIDAKPRGSCPVCNQGFSPATDREWEHRWSYHLLFSRRHKRYLELASKPPARIFLRSLPPQNETPSPTA